MICCKSYPSSSKLIRELRYRQEISIFDLSVLMGLHSVSTLRKIEKGSNPIPIRWVSKISVILGVRKHIIIDAMVNDYRDYIIANTKDMYD